MRVLNKHKVCKYAKLGKVANTWKGKEIKKELGRLDQKDEINWIKLNQRNVCNWEIKM